MLRFLSIRRLAIIDSAEVEFGPGLNVLTGETGAGKSILVEAVGLLLGGRASGDLVRTGEDSAAIEAIFDSGDGPGHGAEIAEIVIRREITAQGRSRAFINGVLATAGALRDLSATLVELHGQHEHQTLLDPSTHLDVLDAFGSLEPLVDATSVANDACRAAKAALVDMQRAAADRESRLELIEFQLAELDRAQLKPADPGEPGEDVELTALRRVLASAERVERLCLESYASLYESDQSILAGLGGVWRRLAELATLDPRMQPYLDTRDGIKSQLEDLALFLRQYAEGIEASPERLQQVEDRLALLDRLKRKHGPTLAEAIARRDQLRRELGELRHSDERVVQLEREHTQARDRYLKAASALSSARRRAAASFSKALVALLGELAMAEARFEVRIDDEPLGEEAWGPRGYDTGEFFLSPNPGEDLRPLARIVSGGELSRVMLAVKTLVSRNRLTQHDGKRGAGSPGLIFDEVDAGIGGRVADVVGRTLQRLGSGFQVLCITHLPQIAAGADAHFLIEKRVEGGRTLTSVRRLNEEGRVEEISRMLGGESVSERLRASAREMIAERRSVAAKAKGESESAETKARVKARKQ